MRYIFKIRESGKKHAVGSKSEQVICLNPPIRETIHSSPHPIREHFNCNFGVTGVAESQRLTKIGSEHGQTSSPVWLIIGDALRIVLFIIRCERRYKMNNDGQNRIGSVDWTLKKATWRLLWRFL